VKIALLQARGAAEKSACSGRFQASQGLLRGIFRTRGILMHELSLAESMLNAALRTDGVTADNLTGVNIRCGAMSGVSVQTLEFCVRLVCEQLDAGEVSVKIEEIPVGLRCKCGHNYEAVDVFSECPECGGSEHGVICGKDVLLESVEVKDG